MRQKRLNAIRQLILKNEIYTQQDLQKALTKKGIQVSQCTLSRDLELMRIEKVLTSSGKKAYSLPEDDRTQSVHGGLKLAITPGFQGIITSGETLLLRTDVGYAQGIALEIDNLHAPEIAGTVIGNSCVLILGSHGFSKDEVIRAVSLAIPELHR